MVDGPGMPAGGPGGGDEIWLNADDGAKGGGGWGGNDGHAA